MAAAVGDEAALELAPSPCGGACEQAAEEGLLAQPPELAFGVESDDGASPAEEPPTARGWGRLRRRPLALAAGALGAALLLGCLAAGAGLWRRDSGPEVSSNLDDEVELGALDSMLSVMGTFADGVHKASDMSDTVQESYHTMQGLATQFNESTNQFVGAGGKLFKALNAGPAARKKLIAKFKALSPEKKAKVKAKLFKRFNITSWKELKPKVNAANMHDGNVCQDDEEEFQQLCYKKCGLLTGAHFPYRISAWECCQKPGPCTENFKIDFRICGGFGTAGDEVGGGCPHTLGGCLKSEELYGNLCYKRCALTTFGVMPDRGGPNTCCKEGQATSMFAFLNDGCITSSDYGTGGGADDDDTSTPAQPHPPSTQFTEIQD